MSRHLRRPYDACSSAKQSLDLASVIPDRDGTKIPNGRTPSGQTSKIICTQFRTPLTILTRNPPESAQVRQSPKPSAAQALSPNSRISPDAHKRPETAFAGLGVKGSWVRIPPARQNKNLGFMPRFLFCLVFVTSGFAEADRRRRSTAPAIPTKRKPRLYEFLTNAHI